MLECVINVSEGGDEAVLARFDAVAGHCLLDRHSDAHHNRSVFTLAGPGPAVEAAARDLARAVVATLDLSDHAGVHPRIGTLDVVPFVTLPGASGLQRGGSDGLPHARTGFPAGDPPDTGAGTGTDTRSDTGSDAGCSATGADAGSDAGCGATGATALAARDRFAAWASETLGLACFLYGPEGPSLPEVRQRAWRGLLPEHGIRQPHPKAGAAAVGARPVLVAYNLWVSADPAAARQIARAIRRPGLRTLGLDVGGQGQVSCNLVDPWHLGPGAVYDMVAAALPPGRRIERAELVGLLPRAVLESEPPERWCELDIEPGRTIEARLERAGLDGGSDVAPS